MPASFTKQVDYQLSWDSSNMSWDSEGYGAVKSWDTWEVARYALAGTETLGVADSAFLRQVFGLFINEAFGVDDSLTKQVSLALAEPLSISESYVDQMEFVIRVLETVNIEDRLAKTGTLFFSDEALVSDALANTFSLALAEGLEVSDVIYRSVTFFRSWSEEFGLSDKLAKTGVLSKDESVAFADFIIRNAEAVMSDISFFAEAFGKSDFIDQVAAAPVGFSDFIPFLAGEHVFKEAVFKTTLAAAASLSRPLLTDVKIAVDVPDVTDQGVASVAVSGTRVVFNKNFFKTPIVKGTVAAGTVLALPRIDADPTGFNVKLESVASPGTFVTGVLNWSAEGY